MGVCERCTENGNCAWQNHDETICREKPAFPITNAERIRAMTDEELAELWWERVDCGECPVHKECKLTGQDCKRLVLNWLKKEATDVN